MAELVAHSYVAVKRSPVLKAASSATSAMVNIGFEGQKLQRSHSTTFYYTNVIITIVVLFFSVSFLSPPPSLRLKEAL
eukprot:SAG31_NODE_6589_length_1961_cov_1.373255_1_plen_78_part_00